MLWNFHPEHSPRYYSGSPLPRDQLQLRHRSPQLRMFSSLKPPVCAWVSLRHRDNRPATLESILLGRLNCYGRRSCGQISSLWGLLPTEICYHCRRQTFAAAARATGGRTRKRDSEIRRWLTTVQKLTIRTPRRRGGTYGSCFSGCP